MWIGLTDMRTIHQLKDYQLSIYRFRIAQGLYLKDIPYENLSAEERDRIMEDARHLLLQTKIRLKLIRLPHNRRKKAWRFVDRL